MAAPEESGHGFVEPEKLLTKTVQIEAVDFLLAAREEFGEQTPLYSDFIKAMLDIKHDSGDRSFRIYRIRKLLDGRTRLLRVFEDLTEGLEPSRDDSKSISDSIGFLQKMKNSPSVSKEDYDGFLKTLLRFHRQRTMTVDDVLQQTLSFMHGCPEILEEFKSFLPARLAQAPLCYGTSLMPMEKREHDIRHLQSDQVIRIKKPSNHDINGKERRKRSNTREIREKFEGKEYNSKRRKINFHNLSCACNDTKIGLDISPAIKEHRISEEVKKVDGYVNCVEEDTDENNEGDGYFLHTNPLLEDNSPPEVDYSKCPRVTHSYVQLPENHKTPQSSCQTTLEKSVLNDHVVSVIVGIEDSIKPVSKTQYEKTMFRCEDEMCHRDVLLERMKTTAQHVEKLQADILHKNMKFEVEKHLTAIDRRCIEQLYNAHGLDILEALAKEPATALPVILDRLNRKVHELKKKNERLNKASGEIIAKNNYRWLQHRSGRPQML